MSLTFPMGFTLSVQEPIDNRLLLTTAQMKAAVKASFPKYYLTICSDGEGAGKIFIFDSTIPKTDKDPVYGYFRPFASSDISLVTSWDTVSDDTAPSSKLVKGSLDGKVDKVTGKQLSTEDYTTAEKTKLAGIEDNAQRNVQSDWNATEGDALILNKPDLSKFITRTVNDLENYYLKSEVDAKLSDVLRLAIVTALPAEGVENVLYLKSTSGPEGKEYDEYIWVNGSWELIGSTDFTLTITQTADGISINGTALQDATVSQDGLMTKEAFAKLDGIEAGAQANVIEGITVDSVPVPIDQKVVNIDLSGKVDKVEGKGLSTNDFTDVDKDKLDALDVNAQENVIETVNVNDVPLVPVDKAVNIDLSGYTTKTLSVGIWDASLTYPKDAVVVLDSVLYISYQDDNIGHDPTEVESDWWMPVESGGGGGGSAAEGVSILFGNTTQTEYHLTHKLQTYDFVYSVRTTTDRRYVHVDVYAEDKNRVMVVLAEPATTSNEFMINIVPVKNTEPGGDDVVVREYTEPALTWSLENATNLPMFIQAFEIDGEHQEMHGDITQEDEESFDPVRVTFSVPKAGIMVASPSTYFYEFTDQTRLVYTPGGDQYYGVQVVTETDNEGVVNPDIVQSNGTITIDFNGEAKTGYVVIIEPKMAIKFENTSLWRVVHNLGRYVGIQAYVIDDGQAMVPVFNVSENECYADFGNTPVSGYLLVI